MASGDHEELQLFDPGEAKPVFRILPDIDIPKRIGEVGVEQLGLYSPEVGRVPTKETKRRGNIVAFGGFVKPTQYDPAGEHDLSKVSSAERAWMTEEQIAKALFTPPKDETALVVDNIALNPYEYGLVVRYPRALARKAVAHVLGDNDLDQDRLAASKRGVLHFFEVKRDPMAEHLAKLQLARRDVRSLLREEKNPGFAHKSPEWMIEHIGATWSEFQIMLDVLRVQRGWDDAKAVRSQAAFISYLTQGPQRTRVSHWKGMTELASNYLGARIHLFGSRLKVVDEKIAENPLQEKDSVSV